MIVNTCKMFRIEAILARDAVISILTKAFAKAMQNILPAVSSTRSNLMESFPVSMSVAKKLLCGVFYASP